MVVSAASVTGAISQGAIAHSENVKATEAQSHREACCRVVAKRGGKGKRRKKRWRVKRSKRRTKSHVARV